MHRDTDMAYCHTCGERETLDDSLILEYDEVLRIGEAHIQKERKYQVATHYIANRLEISFSKKAKKEDIGSDDREWAKYGDDIVRFEQRKKVTKSIEYTLKCAVELVPARSSI
jgi:hypothetical protein